MQTIPVADILVFLKGTWRSGQQDRKKLDVVMDYSPNKTTLSWCNCEEVGEKKGEKKMKGDESCNSALKRRIYFLTQAPCRLD